MAKINPWSLGFISESWHWGSVYMGKESIPLKMSYPQTVVKRKYNQWNLESSEWWELFCSTGKAGRTTSAPSEGHLLSLAAHSREHSEGWSNTAVLLSRPVKGEEHGGVQLSLFYLFWLFLSIKRLIFFSLTEFFSLAYWVNFLKTATENAFGRNMKS